MSAPVYARVIVDALSVHVLKESLLFGKAEPFIVLKVAEAVIETRRMKLTHDSAVWHEKFVFHNVDMTDRLEASVHDSSLLHKDAVVGTCSLAMKQVFEEGQLETRLTLTGKGDGNDVGELWLKARAEDLSSDKTAKAAGLETHVEPLGQDMGPPPEAPRTPVAAQGAAGEGKWGGPAAAAGASQLQDAAAGTGEQRGPGDAPQAHAAEGFAWVCGVEGAHPPSPRAESAAVGTGETPGQGGDGTPRGVQAFARVCPLHRDEQHADTGADREAGDEAGGERKLGPAGGDVPGEAGDEAGGERKLGPAGGDVPREARSGSGEERKLSAAGDEESIPVEHLGEESLATRLRDTQINSEQDAYLEEQAAEQMENQSLTVENESAPEGKERVVERESVGREREIEERVYDEGKGGKGKRLEEEDVTVINP